MIGALCPRRHWKVSTYFWRTYSWKCSFVPLGPSSVVDLSEEWYSLLWKNLLAPALLLSLPWKEAQTAKTVNMHARLCTPRLFQGVGDVPAVCPINTSRLASRELGSFSVSLLWLLSPWVPPGLECQRASWEAQGLCRKQSHFCDALPR